MTRPALDDLLDGLRVVQLPLNTRFRGVLEREIAYVRGPLGYGEFAPFLEYDAAEASRWLASAIEAAWVGWPAAVRSSVPVNATVPAVPADQVADVLGRYDGCRTAKVKVAAPGQSLQDDLDRVAAVRDVMGPDAAIRVDANGGWDVEQARDALSRLSSYGLEYAEQPCETVEELRDLRVALAHQGIDVLVAADESIRKADDPLRVVELEAADVAVIKVAPLGGVAAALEVASACGIPVVVSSALDSSVGMAAGVALAAALPELPYACGLGTLELFSADVTAKSLVPQRGSVDVRDVDVETALLHRWEAPVERRQHWARRVAECYTHLS
ncbi:o-succinylbenzoate synthase [Luteipulveratus mongoliensis]|uniref:o-succinylbenzoate synthase n=1 Tax=Luteipulveratus mongoliensis TaxID=571913 RepID=A0A0K1JN19_9MICO|nr:o-succinylbenzoate synthase [Luteipulveratus mongoliensis]AKU17975.1 O-succinylbenzoate synthase [Luteipulveratus mongoliensis]